MNVTTGGPHARLFRLLLRLYPRRFRIVYGNEMTTFFLARLERARGRSGRLGALRHWLRTAVDVIRTAAAQRFAAPGRANPAKERQPMSSFIRDLRYAGWRLLKAPGFTAAAVAILAVGIGLNAAVFGLVDTLLLRPPPFEDAHRLAHVYQHSDDGDPSSTSFPAYRDMTAMDDVFAGVAATSSGGALWQATNGPQQVSVEYATASYFPVLGLTPHIGRWFDPAHDHVGAGMVAVVSHRAWRTRLGADPDVVGRTIRLNNQPVTIIGVGPASFNGEAGALVTDLWLSISSTPVGGSFRVANLERRQDHWYQVKARLAPGVTVERARAAMDALAGRLAEEFPALNEGRDISVYAYDEVRFHPDADEGVFSGGVGIVVVGALVLLLACANLANLLLVRGIVRAPEMAVRKALGAGRGRVARLLLLEALLVATIGGLAGLGLAAWAVRLVPALPLSVLPGAGLDVGFDHRVVAFGILLTLTTGLVFGLLPALRTAGTDVASAMRDENRGQSAGRRVSLLRGGLVATQAAICVVLVACAGLLGRSLVHAQRVDPGVDAERIAVLGTNLVQGGVSDAAEGVVVARQLLERVEALPGVERAAFTTRLPVQPGGTTTQVVDGYDPPAGTSAVELPFAFVSHGYFETMGIGLLAGRTFSVAEAAAGPPIIVVNEAAARRFWGGDAIGGRIRSQGSEGDWVRVVGVVEDVKVSDIRETPTPMIYYPSEGENAFNLVARTSADPAVLAADLRNALREIGASLPVTRLTTLEAHLGDALSVPRTAATFMGAFSLLALLLAGLGVYAVVSFSVQRRTHELGIRMALGASRQRVIASVVGSSTAVVALGIAVGLGVAVRATRALEGMLFGVAPLDGVTFTGAAALLLVAAGTAALVPARRAAGADPAVVLRAR